MNTLLTYDDVAERLDCSVWMVKMLKKNRRISFVPVGRLVRFTEQDIENYVAKHRRPARGEVA